MLSPLLSPASVAVVGVGRRPGGVGRTVYDALLAGGFAGDIWPINPRATEIGGAPCYPDVGSLPAVADLVVIAVPAPDVPAIVEAAGLAGTGAAVVLSAGFKETGPEGAALERAVIRAARAHDVRVLGPNCLGLMMPAHGLNASFGGPMVPSGSIAVVTQSGALGTAIIDWARSRGGLSAFVSVGNRADISESDLIEAFAADPATKVVAGYLESVVDGPRFLEVARAASRTTPIVLLKAGASEAGARAVSSHTGSLAGSDTAYDAAFAAAGVLRAHDVEELFGTAEALSLQPLPTGAGVAIVTNAGGPAVMATDACERLGLALASLESSTIEALRAVLPSAAAFYNPIDILGDAPPERYAETLRILACDPGVGALLVLLTPQEQTCPDEAAAVIAAAVAESSVPTLACLMGEDAVEAARRKLAASGVPSYRYPERAVDALSAMYRYKELRARPAAAPPVVDADRETVARILREAREAHRPFVLERQAAEIADAYGITTPRGVVARDREAALSAASEMGYPVALKIASPDVLHKTDIGGVVLGIADAMELSSAWGEILDNVHRRMPEAAIFGALVQQMVQPGIEVIVGVDRDSTFGPLIMVGLGGVLVEVLHDVAFRLAPLDAARARAMILSTHAYSVLRGVRGSTPADLDAVIDVLVRVSALVTDFPEIVELDINPLVVADRGGGAVAADVRIGIGG